MCLFLVLSETLISYIDQILKYLKMLMTFIIEKKINVPRWVNISYRAHIQDIHKQTLTRQYPSFNFQYKKDRLWSTTSCEIRQQNVSMRNNPPAHIMPISDSRCTGLEDSRRNRFFYYIQRIRHKNSIEKQQHFNIATSPSLNLNQKKI